MKRGKCLALVAVLAMVVCAFAVALPAGESDASEATVNETISTGENALANGKSYYVTGTAASVTATSGVEATLFLEKGASITTTSIGNGLTIYLVDSKDGSKVTYDANLKIMAYTAAKYVTAAEKKYIATSETTNIGEGSSWGIQFKEATAGEDQYKYYAVGGSATMIEATAGEAVVKNGSIEYSASAPNSATIAVNTIKLTGVKSTDGVTIKGVAGSTTTAGVPLVYGDFYDGTIEVTAGNVKSGDGSTKGLTMSANASDGTEGILNAYSTGDVGTTDANKEMYPKTLTSSYTLTGITHVYGSVNPYTGSVGASGSALTFVDATVSNLIINGTQTITISTVGANGTAGTSALTVTEGTMTLVNGTATRTGEASAGTMVGNSATLKIGTGATLSFNATGENILGAGATLEVLGTITSTATVTITDAYVKNATADAGATFNAFDKAVIGDQINVKTKSVNINGAMQEQRLAGGTINGDTTYYQFQTVIVEGDLTIAEGKSLFILGKIVINEGVTVTVSKKANLVVGTSTVGGTALNNTAEVEINGDLDVLTGGQFIVAGGKSVTISGEVDVSGNMIVKAATTMKNGSVVTIEDGATLDATEGLTVSKGAKLALEGTVGSSAEVSITNKGEVVLDGAIIAKNTTVALAGNEAVVDIKEMNQADNSDKTLTITDNGLKFTTSKKVGDSFNPANTLTIAASGTPIGADTYYMTSDLKVSESAYSYVSDDVTYYVNNLVLSGAPSAKDSKGTELSDKHVAIALTASYGANVDDTLSFGKGVKFTNVLTANYMGGITVNGQMSDLEGTTLVNNGYIYVYGQIQDKNAITGSGTVNAAKYRAEVSGTNYYFYTTLAAAIEAGQTDIAICGSIYMTADLEIPAGVTVSGETGASMTIGSSYYNIRDNTVTVEEGATVKNLTINVDATLVFEANKKSNKQNTIVSDVQTENDDVVKYTNVYTALAGAVAGDEITITKTTAVSISQSIVIPADVTLYVPAGKNLTVGTGVTVTINGELDAREGITTTAENGFSTVASLEKKTSAIIVNGVFKTAEAKGTADMYTQYQAAGAYFEILDDVADFNYIAPVEYAALVAPSTTGGAISVYGANVVSDVEFEGTSTKTVKVTVYGTLVADSVALDRAYITTSGSYAAFTGTVGGEAGAVDLVNAKAFYVAESKDSSGASVVKLYGTIVEGTGELTDDLEVVIASGTVSVTGGSTYDLDIDEATVAEGATLAVSKSTTASIDTLVVEGTAVASNAGAIATDYLTVLGTVTVEPADAAKSISAGSLTASVAYVGIGAEDVTGAAAALNVPEDVTTGIALAYVMAGSTISENVVKNLKSTVYSIEGAEYLTAYMATSGSTMIISLEVPELPGKAIDAWTYIDEKGEVQIITIEKIGAVEEVEAVMDYEVYMVSIVADYGFADVFIDGAKVASISSGRTVYVYDANATYMYLTAGAHTVEWKLKNNYNGDNVTTSFNGSQFSKSFTISSDMPFGTGDDADTPYKLVLTGAVEQGQVTPTEPAKDDGMKVTDYLLIVLVVLIAVMAIMVALRLMRS